MQFDFKKVLSTFKDKMEQMRKDFSEEAQPILFDTFAKVFEQYPEIEAFRWTQSTNCYNDEGYYSGIEYFCVSFNSDMFPDLDDDWYNAREFHCNDCEEVMVKIIGQDRYNQIETLSDTLSKVMERSTDQYDGGTDTQVDMFMMIFGDNRTVTVNRSGFVIGKYSY